MNLPPRAGNTSAQREATSLPFSLQHQKIKKNPFRPLLWLILCISQHLNGHFKVTAMPPDPWPLCYWLLVISVMRDLMQPYMSLRMKAAAKWLKSKHARYWLQIKSLFYTLHIESHFG